MMPVLHLLRELSKSQCWKKENKYTHSYIPHKEAFNQSSSEKCALQKGHPHTNCSCLLIKYSSLYKRVFE